MEENISTRNGQYKSFQDSTSSKNGKEISVMGENIRGIFKPNQILENIVEEQTATLIILLNSKIYYTK